MPGTPEKALAAVLQDREALKLLDNGYFRLVWLDADEDVVYKVQRRWGDAVIMGARPEYPTACDVNLREWVESGDLVPEIEGDYWITAPETTLHWVRDNAGVWHAVVAQPYVSGVSVGLGGGHANTNDLHDGNVRQWGDFLVIIDAGDWGGSRYLVT